MRDIYLRVLCDEPPLDILGFGGITDESREYNEPMLEAIQLSFEGNTESMDDLYWDDLAAKEPVQYPPEVEEDCVDIDYE